MKQYFVYIMTNPARTVLYTGVTNDIEKRVYQHKEKLIDGFTKKYNCIHLIYLEETDDIHSALAREKQIKKWNRQKKEYLINTMNPIWDDLTQ